MRAAGGSIVTCGVVVAEGVDKKLSMLVCVRVGLGFGWAGISGIRARPLAAVDRRCDCAGTGATVDKKFCKLTVPLRAFSKGEPAAAAAMSTFNKNKMTFSDLFFGSCLVAAAAARVAMPSRSPQAPRGADANENLRARAANCLREVNWILWHAKPGCDVAFAQVSKVKLCFCF